MSANSDPQLKWLSVRDDAPLDQDGPVDVPFERFERNWVFTPITQRFDRIAANHANEVAVDDGEICLTYAEVHRGSHILAQRIAAAVQLPGPIGVYLHNPAFFAIAALACLRAGYSVVPIDPRQPSERNALIGREAGLKGIIFDTKTSEGGNLFGALPWLSVINPPGIEPTAAPGSWRAESGAFILYTSGSSGRPKGICNSQSAILQRVAQFTNACHLNSNDRMLLLSATGTIAGVRDTFSALLNGARLVISEPGRVGLDGVLKAMKRDLVTVCYSVPALLRSLCQLSDAVDAFSHLRILRLGGDVVLEGDIALGRSILPATCHILIGYGSTEAPTLFQWFVPPRWSGDGRAVPCGRLLPDLSVAVIDEGGANCKPGDVGELIVQSPYLALGYWQNGRLQNTMLESDGSISFLRLGDHVKIRRDGLMELVGRSSRLIKIKGHRIDPREIESAVRTVAGVAEVAVMARAKSGEPSLDLFVVPRDRTAPPPIERLRASMARQLPAYMQPHRIYFLDAIPLLPGFKPDYTALANWEGEPARAALYPTIKRSSRKDRNAQAVKSAWSKMVSSDSFDRDEAWGNSGGDSLKAMEFLIMIEQALGINVPFDLIDQEMTPTKLIDALDQLTVNGAQDPALLIPPGQAPLVFLCPGVGGDEPALARLRAELGSQVRFVTIRYISSSAMFATKVRLDAIAEAIVRQVRDAIRRDDLFHIVGYSFGGFVAWAVAHRLLSEGFRVGAIGLIDARRTRRTTDTTDVRPAQAEESDTRHLSQFLPLPVLSLLLRLAQGLPARFMTRLPRHYDRELRTRALYDYRPATLNRPVTLFRSTIGIDVSPDHGWRDYCSQLKIVPVAGTHSSIVGPLRRELLAARLLEMVMEAEASMTTVH